MSLKYLNSILPENIDICTIRHDKMYPSNGGRYPLIYFFGPDSFCSWYSPECETQRALRINSDYYQPKPVAWKQPRRVTTSFSSFLLLLETPGRVLVTATHILARPGTFQFLKKRWPGRELPTLGR